MIATVWEFVVKPEALAAFQRALAHYDEMRRSSRQEYVRLDEVCAELTVSERALGTFTVA